MKSAPANSLQQNFAAALKATAVMASKAIPLAGLVRLANAPPLIVYYHIVSDEDLPHAKHLYSYKSRREFEGDIDYLLKTYTPLCLEDLFSATLSGEPLPSTSIFFTFDDGLREMYDVVCPILRRKGVPAAFFISSAFVDNKDLFFRFKASIILDKVQGTRSTGKDRFVRQLFNKWGLHYDDLRSGILKVGYHQRQLLDELADLLEVDFLTFLATHKPYMDTHQIEKIIEEGFHVGGHSIDHPPFRSLTIEEQVHQTEENMNFLRQKFRLLHGFFSFPFSAAGVPDEYFKRMGQHGLVDLFFGTEDFGVDRVKHLFHRVAYDWTKPHSIKRKYVQYIFSKTLGRYPL